MRTLTLLLLLAVSSGVFAQNRKYQFMMPQSTFGIGVAFQEFDGLKDRMANFSQYEALKDYSATIQLGWQKERDRLISSSGIMLGSSMSGDRDKKSSTVRFIGLGADIGYDLIKSEKVMLYPLAGIGYEFYQARFFTDNSGVDFDDVVGSPTVQNAIRPLALRNSFFTYRLGMGVSLTGPKDHGGSIGVQAGYVGSFDSRNWKSNDNQVLNNAPKDQLGRFQVSLILSHQPMMHGKSKPKRNSGR